MLNWLESRTGFVSLTKEFLTEDVPGGASYWYVFGSATLFAMIVQIVTGIFLTFFYAPSAATAWESTRAIYLNPFTHFLLSVHYWGASAMIALVFLHLLQVLIFGAYKSPRELQMDRRQRLLLLLVTLVHSAPYRLSAAVGYGRVLRVASLAQHHGPSARRRHHPEHRPRRRHDGHRNDQSILRPARVADARGAGRLSRRASRHLPPQRLGRTGGRRSAQTEGRALLAGSDVHGRRGVVHRLHHHHDARDLPAAVPRRKGRPDEVLRAVSGVVFLVALRATGTVPAGVQDRRTLDLDRVALDDRDPNAVSAGRPRDSVARPQHDAQLQFA